MIFSFFQNNFHSKEENFPGILVNFDLRGDGESCKAKSIYREDEVTVRKRYVNEGGR